MTAPVSSGHGGGVGRARDSWRPALGDLRLVGDGRTVLHLSRDAAVLWWCGPDVDDTPLCWQLLDRDGGTACYPDLVGSGGDDAPAAASVRTLLSGPDGPVEARDALLRRRSGVLLVRLLRRAPVSGRPPVGRVRVRHLLRLGGFDGPAVALTVSGDVASGVHRSRGQAHLVEVGAAAHELVGAELHSSVELVDDRWSVLSVGIGAAAERDADSLVQQVEARSRAARQRLVRARLPRVHPSRALDALAVLRACTYEPTAAVVAAPTTSLPEAPGHDRQFDYRFSWLRDASLSTAVAALLGQGAEARRYLEFVHEAWGDQDLLTRPVAGVRGESVPGEREVADVAGWAGSRPVRVGNGARDQTQYDAVGLLVEAVSVHVQVGGALDDRTWALVRRLAEQVAADDPEHVKDSNGIWELRTQQPLVDGDLGRWLVLDRALWIARGWRPWTRRRHWRTARDVIARRVVGALDADGLLPQAYGQDPPVPDASALMAVAFGLLSRDDPRASRLVDALVERLGTGPYLYRYPPGGDDGFSGREGAFLPVSFLAVTALARTGRVEDAQRRLDALCAALPRLLSEEVDPATDELLGNTPLVWSHAELARAVYVLDAALRRQRWGVAGLWAWRLQRYVRLRWDRGQRATVDQDRPQQGGSGGGDAGADGGSGRYELQLRRRPAGPPAASVRPSSGGVGRSSSAAAEAVSDALRRGSGGFLEQRRRMALLQTASAAALAIVGLYQFGVLRSVPEPPLPGLGADAVDAAGQAYVLGMTPDSALGIASAGVSLVLAGMGSEKRYREQPWVPLALLAKSVLDATSGGYLLAEQVTKHKRICSWCTASAALLVATVPTALPEARAAWKAWRSTRSDRPTWRTT